MAKKQYLNALSVGHRFGWYRIDEVLGQGGFGITYLATNLNLDRQEAIKEYLPREIAVRRPDDSVSAVTEDDHAPFRHGLKGFIAEARTLAKFKHPNIVRVLNVFEAKGTAYMAMEYEQGRNLETHLQGGEYADEHSLKALLGPLLSALEYMHDRQFIHRDVKPANIFIRADGSPVLLDFGSARIALGEETHTLTAMVTQGYAPFEQYHAKKGAQGPWTDIYALAATAYRGIARRPPVDAVLRGNARIDDHPDPLTPASSASSRHFSRTFLVAIDRALAFKASERPQSVAEWRELLGARPRVTEGKATRAGRPSRIPAVMVAALTLAVLTTGAWYVWQQDLSPKKRTEVPSVTTEPAPALGDDAGPRLEQAEREAAQANAEIIQQYLSEAKAALEKGSLAGAAPDTAESRYRAVLALDAENSAAGAGLEDLAERLAERAVQAVRNEDLVGADAWLNDAQRLNSRADSVLRAEKVIFEIRREVREREREQKRLAELTIAELLEKARASLAANRLTTPPTDSALKHFQTLSEFSPGHPAVESGYAAIVDGYIVLAARARRKQDYEGASTFLDKAVDVIPDSPALGKARNELAAEVEGIRVQAEREEKERRVEIERQARLRAEQKARRQAEAARRLGVPDMAVVRGGCFPMGSRGSESGRDSDEDRHQICVNDFRIGKTEVTFAQYDRFVEATGRDKPDDRGWGRGDLPVINVSWRDASAYARWLSEKTGRNYRLPTEAEWEYAARAGSTSAYPWGDSIRRNKANCDGCGSRWDNKQTAPVGSFAPNALGLFDTAGNVYEWTCSKYAYSYAGDESRCAGRNEGGNRVLRGGSWSDGPAWVRSASRFRGSSATRGYFLGFRLAGI